ncbi:MULTISPECIES: YqaJ viral recombinase family protein [unclassified Streptomyces]|uniref:YqaJ viral recombinase family nuclease n=1 Tax=unclassified Streptomyces TaxID=2593676 RepID=UPI00224DFE28|nr:MULTISPECIES: YqaJ viral recombinase family protein [unclassified Streptomyces]MCX4863502.1 YqaJ viral recombinase family protein [Streptomyces sp. NBC_00906]MCX4894740.1 YqaJ viral recombinase family protein [Streptomyces sp. NBC_00892]
MTAFNPPTGVLLGQYTPGTEEWEQARAGLCITATEIAAVMGLSPWASRFSLWHKKAGLPTPPFETNPAVEWGNRLEDAVAQKFADEHPELELRTTGTWRHRDREWQRATPDRIAQDRLVEVKTSPFGDGWGPAGSDELPIYYRCQVQWQLDTLGLDVCHVALLVSGHDYREYVVEYDAGDAKVMRDAAEEFLDDVRQGNRPAIDGADATYQTIRVQPVGRDDRDVEISAEYAADYDIAQQAYRAADTELTRARGQILDAIGTGYRAVHGDRRIAYRTVKDDGSTLALQPYRGTSA